MKKGNYTATIGPIADGGKGFRFQIKSANGRILNHSYETKAGALKSLRAFLEAVREGRITVEGVE